jgi:hypothetical protein
MALPSDRGDGRFDRLARVIGWSSTKISLWGRTLPILVPVDPLRDPRTGFAAAVGKLKFSHRVQNDLESELLDLGDFCPNAVASFPPPVWVKA